MAYEYQWQYAGSYFIIGYKAVTNLPWLLLYFFINYDDRSDIVTLMYLNDAGQDLDIKRLPTIWIHATEVMKMTYS